MPDNCTGCYSDKVLAAYFDECSNARLREIVTIINKEIDKRNKELENETTKY